MPYNLKAKPAKHRWRCAGFVNLIGAFKSLGGLHKLRQIGDYPRLISSPRWLHAAQT